MQRRAWVLALSVHSRLVGGECQWQGEMGHAPDVLQGGMLLGAELLDAGLDVGLHPNRYCVF